MEKKLSDKNVPKYLVEPKTGPRYTYFVPQNLTALFALKG